MQVAVQAATQGAQAAAAAWPRQLVWFNDPWLSTATLAAIKDGMAAVAQLPKGVQRGWRRTCADTELCSRRGGQGR